MTRKKSGDKDKEKEIEKLSFEQAMERLEDIVVKIENGQTGLEDAISQYEYGCKLINRCRAILDEAERKIEMLDKDMSGRLRAKEVSGELSEEINEGKE